MDPARRHPGPALPAPRSGSTPTALFDTELAGRLLGYPRVGLATLVETLLGYRLAKEHSAVDWSTRPLPEPWLEYAALDVEVLVELRDAARRRAGRDRQGRLGPPGVRPPARLRAARPGSRRGAGRPGCTGSAAAGRWAPSRALWEARDEIAAQRDVTPGRIVPDAAIVAAAQAMPADRAALLATKGFHGRGAERYSARWVAALREVAEMDEEDLPARAPRGDGPPLPRAWAERDPVAARRLVLAREAMAALADEHDLPVENLLTPDYLRRTLWEPPATRDPGELLDAVAAQLSGYGARSWQIALDRARAHHGHPRGGRRARGARRAAGRARREAEPASYSGATGSALSGRQHLARAPRRSAA